MAHRLQRIGQEKYKNGFKVTLHEDLISLPLRWKKPRHVFVNSMSDIFHKDVPLEFILRIFETMQKAHWHVFQLLTKRSNRLSALAGKLPWPENVWMGVTVESARQLFRISDLQTVPAAVRFLSMEPLLGPVPNLPTGGIGWVIVGGESGPNARPMEKQWVIEIRNQCIKKGIPFFFKQWGGFDRKKSGRILEDKYWEELPDACPAAPRPTKIPSDAAHQAPLFNS
jgi:protein gp37